VDGRTYGHLRPALFSRLCERVNLKLINGPHSFLLQSQTAEAGWGIALWLQYCSTIITCASCRTIRYALQCTCLSVYLFIWYKIQTQNWKLKSTV